MTSPWPKNVALRVLAALWSSLWGMVGLLGAALFLVLGWAEIRARAGAVEIWGIGGPLVPWMAANGWEGFTLGWSIWFWSPPEEGDLIHEREHVFQNLRWGPLWPVAYLVVLPFTGYRNHPFEVAAYTAQRIAGYPNDP